MSDSAPIQSPAVRPAHVLALRISAKRLPRPLIQFARSFCERLIGFTQFNAIYHRIPPCDTDEFPQKYLDEIRMKVEWLGQSPDSIPPTGPLIVVSNHPFGLIESMAIRLLIIPRRKDLTAMVSSLFYALPDYRDRFIFVGPRSGRRHRERSVEGLRKSFQWLKRGGSLLIFPASRVSRFHWRNLSITDEPWSPHVAGLARRTGASVLPVYIHGRNSWLFQLAGIFSPEVQNLLVIGQATNKRGYTVRGKIGQVISPELLAACATDEEAIALMRLETWKLAKL